VEGQPSLDEPPRVEKAGVAAKLQVAQREKTTTEEEGRKLAQFRSATTRAYEILKKQNLAEIHCCLAKSPPVLKRMRLLWKKK